MAGACRPPREIDGLDAHRARHRGFAATTAPEGFDLEAFEEVGLGAVERRFGPKEAIFTPDDQLYFLSGTGRLYEIYGDYKEATTALLKDGGVFGEPEAVTESRVAGIQKAALERVIKGNPDEFALRLFSSLSERLRQSDEVIESLLHREVSTRLATLLINLGDRFGEEDGRGLLVDVRLTHRDLANMIASTREAVSKVMSELQRGGVIETGDRKITILDRGALAERASGPSGLSVDGQLSI